MKIFLSLKTLVPVLFVAAIVIFSFANSASKVLDEYNPVKTAKEAAPQERMIASKMPDTVAMVAEGKTRILPNK